jgi:lycopene cyclase domain-containing protein
VRHLGYAAMLAFCVVGTLPLELYLKVGVYRRLRRLALTLLPVVPLFVGWDLYAVSRHHWRFDPAQTLSVFVVVPVAAVLTLEAVRVVRGWRVGDEP